MVPSVTTCVIPSGLQSWTCRASWVGCAFLLAWIGSVGLAAESSGNAPGRLAVPSKEELKPAEEAVRAIFADQATKARTPHDRSEVARMIFGKHDPMGRNAETYAMLMAALNLAAQGDDASLVLTIADKLADVFAVDRLDLVASRIGGITGPILPATWPALSSQLNGIARECLRVGKFDQANDVIAAYSSMAKRARDPKTASAAAELKKTVTERKKADEKITALLARAAAPDADAKALTDLGKILCFVRGDWERGLPYLARCDDPALVSLARQDLASRTVDQRLAIADAWASLGRSGAAADRDAITDYAVAIYTAAIPELDGLAKVKAEKALDEILESALKSGKSPSAWQVIFRSADSKLWNTSSSQDPRNYAIPLADVPPNVRYVRIKRSNGDQAILPITKDQLDKYSPGPRFGWQGSKQDRYGVILLGIADRKTDVSQNTGSVAVVQIAPDCCSGWGFGIKINQGPPLAMCWNGKTIPNEPLEIAVLSRALTAEERKFLLE